LIDDARIRAGHRVLDVACGTGEPALSIARRFGPSITVVGVDAAEAMVARARAKARAEALLHAHFAVMHGERLDFASAQFDRVVSRFGLMLFDDPVQGAREIWRVLKPGGRATLAVWGPLEQIETVYSLWRLLGDYLPPTDRPPEPRMSVLGAPGALQRALAGAGWTAVRVEPLAVTYRFPNPRAFWDLVTEAGLFKDLLTKLSCHALVAFKARALADIAYHRTDTDSMVELTNQAWLAVADAPAA